MIDFNRVYATIYGPFDEMPGAKYEQDGKIYNSRGEQLGPGGKVVGEIKSVSVDDAPVADMFEAPPINAFKERSIEDRIYEAHLAGKKALDIANELGVTHQKVNAVVRVMTKAASMASADDIPT